MKIAEYLLNKTNMRQRWSLMPGDLNAAHDLYVRKINRKREQERREEDQKKAIDGCFGILAEDLVSGFHIPSRQIQRMPYPTLA